MTTNLCLQVFFTLKHKHPSVSHVYKLLRAKRTTLTYIHTLQRHSAVLRCFQLNNFTSDMRTMAKGAHQTGEMLIFFIENMRQMSFMCNDGLK